MGDAFNFPVFDADNHMYEQPDAFTRYLPTEYKHVVHLMVINGRKKPVINNTISEYIQNPTFNVVARTGAQSDFFKNGNPEGKSRREILGEPIRSPESFFRPEPRLSLIDEQGVDRALMWQRKYGSQRFDQAFSEEIAGRGVAIPSGSLTIPPLPAR